MKSVSYPLIAYFIQAFVLADAMASTTISSYLDSNDNPLVYTVGLGTKKLTTEYSAGNSTTSAIKTYIPVESEGDGERPDANLLGGDIISENAGSVRFDLKIVNTEASERNLIGALKIDGEWTVVYKNTIAASTTYEPYSTLISGSKFWTDITELSSTIKDYYLYFFASTTAYALGDTFDDSAQPSGGLYFRTYLSGKLYTSATYDPRLSTPQKGDGRIFLGIQTELIPHAYKALVISYPSAQSVEINYADATSDTVGNGTVFDRDFAACNGEEQLFTVSGLNNASIYHLAVACVDKFFFATNFSSSVSEAPESIEAFLQKNACYLISAGFQREHYVLAYFRDFRDQVLANTSFGRDFISWYYRSAPKYALIIAHSPVLSSLMRGIAYSLYFIFIFWKLLLITVPLVVGLSFFKLRQGLTRGTKL